MFTQVCTNTKRKVVEMRSKQNLIPLFQFKNKKTTLKASQTNREAKWWKTKRHTAERAMKTPLFKDDTNDNKTIPVSKLNYLWVPNHHKLSWIDVNFKSSDTHPRIGKSLDWSWGERSGKKLKVFENQFSDVIVSSRKTNGLCGDSEAKDLL